MLAKLMFRWIISAKGELMSRTFEITKGATEIRLGLTDCFRYIAFQPPLTSDEVEGLFDQARVNPDQVEQIPGDEACTQFGYYTEGFLPGEDREFLKDEVAKIVGFLNPLRETVEVNPDLYSLMGHNSSPFDPYTDK
jgi:hypothetical protein